MDKDNDYYRTLDLRRLAQSIPADKEARGRSAAFQEMLIALVLRCPTESFTGSDLLILLGEPDSIETTENAAVWEYAWQGEHCARPIAPRLRFSSGMIASSEFEGRRQWPLFEANESH